MYRCYGPVISSRVKGEAERSEPQVCLWGPAKNNQSVRPQISRFREVLHYGQKCSI